MNNAVALITIVAVLLSTCVLLPLMVFYSFMQTRTVTDRFRAKLPVYHLCSRHAIKLLNKGDLAVIDEIHCQMCDTKNVLQFPKK